MSDLADDRNATMETPEEGSADGGLLLHPDAESRINRIRARLQVTHRAIFRAVQDEPDGPAWGVEAAIRWTGERLGGAVDAVYDGKGTRVLDTALVEASNVLEAAAFMLHHVRGLEDVSGVIYQLQDAAAEATEVSDDYGGIWPEGDDEPAGNRAQKSDDPPANASGNRSGSVEGDTVELPRRLVEELVQGGNLLAHALPDLTALEAPSFTELEVARQLTREYASRVDDVVVKMEKALGVEDTDALFEGVRETYAAAARAKRRKQAEELGGAS